MAIDKYENCMVLRTKAIANYKVHAAYNSCQWCKYKNGATVTVWWWTGSTRNSGAAMPWYYDGRHTCKSGSMRRMPCDARWTMNENGSHDVRVLHAPTRSLGTVHVRLREPTDSVGFKTTVLWLLHRNYILQEERELIFCFPADGST